MEQVSGFPLLKQQYTALLKKNLLLSLRNKKAAFLQLTSPVFFMLLMFAIGKASMASTAQLSYYKNMKDPQETPFPPIPPCENKVMIKKPCFDFVWSGEGNYKFRAIVNRILRNNPGRRIPHAKVKSFKDKAAVDEWLLNNPMQCPGAIHFMEKSQTIFSYGIQSNSTATPTRDGKYEEDPNTTFQLPLQLAAEREIARYLLRDPRFSWNVFLEEYAHPSEKPFSVESLMSSMFYLSIVLLHFILQMSNVVTEKELKLRQSMNTMGLYDTAYWLSWVTWEVVMTFISSLLTVLVGMALQFPIFLKNSFVVVFLAFFLFQLSMTTMGFAFTAFIGKSSSATAVGTTVFLVGSILQFVTSFGIYEIIEGKARRYLAAASLLPPTLFGHALYLLSEASSNPEDNGLSWTDAWKCPVKAPKCKLTMGGVYGGFLGLFFGWFVLAIYFDNIVPNVAGVRKSCYYFLLPGYWLGKGAQQVKDGLPDIFFCFGGQAPAEEHGAPDDEDVIEEENKVKRQVAEGVVDENVAVQIRGLVKSYKGTVGFKCKKSAPYTAVKGLWVNFQKDQLFCLLGPNGAGKTTTIGCLTGISPVTDGDAFIHGNTIRTSSGMSNIQKLIGVCPQFDILWHTLTGEEHLHLFATIKGLPPSSIPSITKAALEEVKLTEAATVRAGSYSGGMKRRLSVAGALMGDPKLVILDEPTTGMDPITRRHVWDIIENAKKGRAIVLTTHSMEEADILSDRIGIMAKGKLRCIGTSIRLKSRFGSGFIANISFHADAVSTSHSNALKQFFKSHLDVEPKEENNNFLTFVIPHDREKLLKDFFAELQDREEEFGVSDIQLGLTTLEEVFLNIAKQAELEGAAAEGKLTTLTLTSGESAQIPVGARFVGIPETESEENTTGFMVEVYWEVDDNGKLVIAGHSRKVPIPPGIELSSERLRKKLQRSRSVHGIVIDPSQVSSDDFK